MKLRLAETDQLDVMEGVLLQPMVTGGVEVMIGVTDDPLFGPLIAFGLGGIHVEILGDVQFRITPLTDRDATEMIRGIKGYRLLTGYRGHPPADLDALEETLLRVSRLVEEIPEIRELDLNPIFVRLPLDDESPCHPSNQRSRNLSVISARASAHNRPASGFVRYDASRSRMILRCHSGTGTCTGFAAMRSHRDCTKSIRSSIVRS